MSYNIHITRAKEWFTDDSPITFEEMKQAISSLTNFAADETGIITTTTPDGKVMKMEVGPYIKYCDGNEENAVYIYFNRRGPIFGISEDKQILPILSLANELGATIQGDELEIYTQESILGGE